MPKMQQSATLSALALLILLVGCGSEETELPNGAVLQAEQAAPLQSQFDVPALLRMSQAEVRASLGEPTTEFQPTSDQVALDIAPTLEYERGSTTLALDFGASDTITEAFLSDKTEGRTAEEMHQLGNVDLRSTEYEISTQAWANPTLAQQNREPEVAGIRIRRPAS